MLVIGTGGFASDFIGTMLHQMEPSEIVLYNDTEDIGNSIYKDDFRIITSKEEAKEYFEKVDNRFIVCIGDNIVREQITKEFLSLGGINPSFISKETIIGPKATIAPNGVLIMQYASVGSMVEVKEGTILYINSGIGHGSKVGRYCLVSAAVNTSQAEIGDYSMIGIGVSIKPGVKLGKHSTVGVGAVVTQSFHDHAIIYGNPAKLK